ncbi:hypothetical protein ADUPG1_009791 [Aduncisulcus paluster]|uniref:Uncharacterized protein n=1 Tax=Aduncisulcus paluster TaxID=2918883 RepID=A0ABQ5KZL4_9EUKA|nr:hypothetical protein ADUPG1_009791 [Aduncisulcus paluster]
MSPTLCQGRKDVKPVKASKYDHLRFIDVLFSLAALDEYVLTMSVLDDVEGVDDLLHLIRLHRSVWVPLCVLANSFTAGKVISKLKPHLPVHLKSWIQDCGRMSHYSAQVGERLNKNVKAVYSKLLTTPQKHKLAAEVLPFLHIKQPTTYYPDIHFKEDKYYYFDNEMAIVQFKSSLVSGTSIKGKIFRYDQEQLEIKCSEYPRNIIGFYVYSLVSLSLTVPIKGISGSVNAVTAGDLGYTSFQKDSLVVPARSGI